MAQTRGGEIAEPLPAEAAATLSSDFEVRWADVDANRHMRNTAYSEYATHARLRYLRAGGFSPDTFERLRFGPVIFREETRFRREVLFGETIRVHIEGGGLARDDSAWRIFHRFTRGDGQAVATLEVEGAWMNLDTRRLIAPPPELAALLRAAPRTASFEELPSVLAR